MDSKSQLHIAAQSVNINSAHLEDYFKDVQSGTAEDTLKYEWVRYESFKTFPVSSPAMPSRLAASGFYYIGPCDRVQCFSCKLFYGDWKLGDIPLEVHKRLSPSCRFFMENETVNVPIHNQASSSNNTNEFSCSDRCQGSQNGIGGCYLETHEESDTWLSNFIANCKHPQYKELPVRLSSYAKWPCGNIQAPEDLAEAGFFYAGFGDCVRCFFCGLGLRNWEYGDGAWSEHARWSSDCLYLRQFKSVDFIQKYQETGNNEVATGATYSENKPDPKMKIQQESRRGHGPGYETESKTVTKSGETADNSVCDQITKQVMEMGFQPEIVSEAMKKYRATSDNTPDCSELLDLILSAKNTRERKPLSSSTSSGNSSLTRDDKKSRNRSEAKSFVEKIDRRQKPSLSSYDSTLSIDGLQDENRRFKNQLQCKICMDGNANVVFLPCGHMIACVKCSPALRKCGICRQRIRDRVKIT